MASRCSPQVHEHKYQTERVRSWPQGAPWVHAWTQNTEVIICKRNIKNWHPTLEVRVRWRKLLVWYANGFTLARIELYSCRQWLSLCFSLYTSLELRINPWGTPDVENNIILSSWRYSYLWGAVCVMTKHKVLVSKSIIIEVRVFSKSMRVNVWRYLINNWGYLVNAWGYLVNNWGYLVNAWTYI